MAPRADPLLHVRKLSAPPRSRLVGPALPALPDGWGCLVGPLFSQPALGWPEAQTWRPGSWIRATAHTQPDRPDGLERGDEHRQGAGAQGAGQRGLQGRRVQAGHDPLPPGVPQSPHASAPPPWRVK
eukprot:scaffold5744_cov33-Phaeocystis_antarctica.AAC.4